MENYINNFENYSKNIVYNFNIGYGGIADCLKFFMYLLDICINNNYKLYYLVNNINIEKYLQLKYKKMYITRENINNQSNIDNIESIKYIDEDSFIFVEPFSLYPIFNINNINIKLADVFKFSDEIKINRRILLSENINNYISIHLRLGDKYLETNKDFVCCIDDERQYDENKIFNFIEENKNKPIIFFCDNNSYKSKIKEKYQNIIIINSEIGHTTLLNTTDKQTLDTITEFYIMTNSEQIISASDSGFSTMAAKFKKIPLINL